jgi:hypothetical protein
MKANQKRFGRFEAELSPQRKVDMNTFAFLFGIQAAGQPALRIAFTIALLLPQGVGIFIYKRRDQFFGAIPK